MRPMQQPHPLRRNAVSTPERQASPRAGHSCSPGILPSFSSRALRPAKEERFLLLPPKRRTLKPVGVSRSQRILPSFPSRALRPAKKESFVFPCVMRRTLEPAQSERTRVSARHSSRRPLPPANVGRRGLISHRFLCRALRLAKEETILPLSLKEGHCNRQNEESLHFPIQFLGRLLQLSCAGRCDRPKKKAFGSCL